MYRDLGEDLSKHFHRLINAVLSLVTTVTKSAETVRKGVGAPSPELTGKLFECVSHMLR